MEKQLLLLGVLRDHEVHGYQLNEMLGSSAGLPIRLSKANAYKLLKKMEVEGWVSYREEQEGNRPPRRVYTITDEGEAAFQRMLRNSLASYLVPEFPGAVGLNFLELLPAEEAMELLRERRDNVVLKLNELDTIDRETREKHPGIAYLWRFFQCEIGWLDEIITRLNDA